MNEVATLLEARQLLLAGKITADSYSQAVSRIRSQASKPSQPKAKA